MAATNVKLTAFDTVTGATAIQLFTISVPLNHTPQFTKGADQSVNEESVVAPAVGWATSIVKGPPYEDGQTLTFLVVADKPELFSIQPAVSADGTLTYTLAPDAVGVATVTVRLMDNGGNDLGGVDTSDPQTFTITITAVNDAPTISTPGLQTTLEDTSKVISGLLVGDVDAGSSNVTVTLAAASGTVSLSTNVANGLTAAQVSGNGTSSVTITAPLTALNTTLASASGLTYLPSTDFNGSDTLTIGVDDGGNTGSGGAQTANATIAISVTPVNDAPSFTLASLLPINEDAPLQTEMAFATFIVGPTDESTQVATSFTVTQIASTGNLTFVTAPSIDPTNGTLTYQPTAQTSGTATFNVTLTDNGGTANGGVDTSVTQTFIISVTEVNDTPTFTLAGDPPASNEDGGLQSVANFTANISAGPASEVGQTLTFMLAPAGTTGGLTFATAPSIDPTTGTLTYRASPDSNGTATFDVTLVDDGVAPATSTTQTFTITVNAVTDIVADSLTTNEDAAVTANVITGTNGASADNFEGTATLTNATNGTNGTVTFTAAGSVTYTPNPDFNGSDSFTYTVTSGGATETTTVTVTVNAVVDIVADALTTGEDTPITANLITRTNGASADSFAVGAVLTSVTQPTNGTVTFTVAGSVTYTPNADFNGVDSFTYTVTSGGVTETGTVTVTISAVADIVDDTLTTAEDTPVTANVITGTNGASADSFEGTESLTSVTQGANGTVTFTAAGSVTYTPNADFNGADSFTYTVTSGGVTETATVMVTISAAVDITPDTLTTDEDTAITANVITGTNGATADTFEGTAVLTSVTQGTNGTVSFTATGDVTYTPNTNFNGTDSFDYTVTSGGVTESATVTVNVNDVNDPPTFTLNSDTDIANPKVLLTAGPQSIANWATVSPGSANEAGQILTFSVVSIDNPGLFRVLPRIVVQPSGTATLTFTPMAGFGGTANVTVRLSDNGTGTNTSATQTITITTYLADVTYTAVGSKRLRAVVVDGRLTVQTGGIAQSGYLPAFIETLTLNGGTGDDLINLSGLDPLLYPNLTSIIINGGNGKDAITFNSISTNAFDNLTTLSINGGAGNDLINLTSVPTSLLPAITTLQLNGGADNDTIFGSDLNDTITGGTGNDSLNGLGGTDRVVESANVSFKLTNTSLTGVGTDKLANIEEASLTGGAGNNRLDASAFTL